MAGIAHGLAASAPAVLPYCPYAFSLYEAIPTMHRITPVLTVLFLILIAAPATATQAAQPAGDQTFERLQAQFERLYVSLQGLGGMRESDRPVVEELRDRFARFNAKSTGHAGGLAGEIQLSMWLEDHDRVDTLFAQLVEAAPDQPRFGLAWLEYLNRNEMNERADEVFQWLLANTEDTTFLRINRARDLKRRSEYADALAMLEVAPIDPAEDPEAQMLLAELLHAENRFAEAIAALDAIPDEALAGSGLRTQVNRLERDFAEIAELWKQEEELRSEEAAADNLPRVELVTARGRIVLELFEDSAPNTVANFISLVESGFYNETKFHAVLPESMTQGGDPYTRPGGEGLPGTGGPGYRIADEWERENARRHFAGSIAMTHSGPDTAGSRFYIAHKPLPQFNRGYTVFGRILEGLDIVREMKQGDELITAHVLRKRDHEYEVETLRSLEEIEEGVPEFLRSGPQ